MKHILIVEDMDDHAYILQRMFNQLSILTSICVDPFVILKKVRDKVVDGITVDLTMPGLSGLDVIKYVRQVDAEIPIVVITAACSDDSRIHCLQAGATYYLTKPCTLTDLKAIFKK